MTQNEGLTKTDEQQENQSVELGAELEQGKAQESDEKADVKEQTPQVSQNPQDDNGYFGKPECYDYKDVELDPDFEYDQKLLKDFNEIAAKYNLSQKSANELMTMAVRLSKQTQENLAAAYAATTQSKIKSYKDALLNDSEIGGKNLSNSLKVANMAYEKFADGEVKTMLADAGLNYHPKVVKMFMQIGKQMQNDNIRPANNAQPFKEAREDILFPSMQ